MSRKRSTTQVNGWPRRQEASRRNEGTASRKLRVRIDELQAVEWKIPVVETSVWRLQGGGETGSMRDGRKLSSAESRDPPLREQRPDLSIVPGRLRISYICDG